MLIIELIQCISIVDYRCLSSCICSIFRSLATYIYFYLVIWCMLSIYYHSLCFMLHLHRENIEVYVLLRTMALKMIHINILKILIIHFSNTSVTKCSTDNTSQFYLTSWRFPWLLNFETEPHYQNFSQWSIILKWLFKPAIYRRF